MKAQNLNWNDLQLVAAVCDEGTLSGAARKLGVNHSTVFRRIKALEKSLNVRLFERLPRGYVMTEAGEAFFVASDKIGTLVNDLARNVTGQDLKLHGTLRVAVPDAILLEILVPNIHKFVDIYPDIQLELISANSYANLTRREADVAIRATRRPADTLFGRKLCNLATAFYVHKDKLAACENLPNTAQSWLMPDESLGQLPASQWIAKNCPDANFTLASNMLLCLKEAAKAGLGIAPLPCFMGDAEPTLVRFIEPNKALQSEVWLLTHQDLKYTARVRVFMDFLIALMSTHKNLLEGRQR